ncbi:hypothetical protein CLV84_1467 [Neolewinella xylanilytica]|uniref:Uncharacterized protein n=1 Tax=Neolewinella xylanilytica TaxID=1514080 RepID=A0A2S6IAL4_9BACT|nr:hypothetical protein [Neolewinella xylanilytica]PPK88499.1 hypothetical protein CLV84_1467 [Neolewinella xylanilytica]
MSSCEFPITFHQPIRELTERIAAAVEAKGGSFTVEEKGGRFSIPTAHGAVAGSYRAEKGTFHYVLTDLPPEVSCHKAENTFRSLIGSPPDLSLDFT